MAENSASVRQCAHRIGFGNDVHRLALGRDLVLGGIHIPFGSGPEGHSDGDALAHAVCDALLGAAALGDIGQHFPDTAPEWHGASSLVFLRRAAELLGQAGFSIVNVDTTVSLERPKLRPHIAQMRETMAAALSISAAQISIKAKTGEGVDAVGTGAALRADAVVLIESKP